MKVLKVFIYGGLGNQMFQYAFARYIANKFSLKLILNIYGFKIDRKFKRDFSLLNFGIEYDLIENNNKFMFNFLRIIQHFPKINYLITKIFFKNIIVDKGNIYDLNQLPVKLKSQVNYMYGYWHDERYFKDISEVIRFNFNNIKHVSKQNKLLLNIIDSLKQNSVAIHFRSNHMQVTGEEKTPIASYQVHKDYYKKSIELIQSKINNPSFIVFSDKPPYAKKYFSKFDIDIKVLENDRGEDYEDFWLMSKCHNHIIANSSFSWWSAWIQSNQKNQIKIAPKNTHFTPKIPNSWISI